MPSEFQTIWICQARSEPVLSANVISGQKMTESKAPSPNKNSWIRAKTANADRVRGNPPGLDCGIS